jgi:Tfp pilus assembly protein PilV
MKSNTPHPSLSGFVLIEALVALLLLATAMMGAGIALVDALSAQRAALLQTRAADLAGNLAEALRSAPDLATAQAEIQSWQGEVLLQLPQAQPQALQRPRHLSPASLPAGFDIHLQWREGRSSAFSQLTLPVALATSPDWS